MADSEARPYVVEHREVVAETDNLRVSILTFAPGQEVPWHYHSRVTDTFYCLEGVLSVETRTPPARHLLDVGESCAVPPMTAHRVTGRDGGRARFLIVQGVGTYDFCPAGRDRPRPRIDAKRRTTLHRAEAPLQGDSNMPKQTIVAEQVGGSYSSTTVHATSAAGLVFVTGQVANRPDSAPAGDPLAQVELGGLEEQTVRVMENIRVILEKAGTGFEHVVKRNVYITHASDFETVYAVMERYFESPVASTGVITGLVPPSARVEVDVIAALPDA